MNKWDAIVIGAGNAGMVCAAKLAKEGKKTLLLERHNLPGGFATSFKRGRFEFEASLHELCGFGSMPGQGNVRQVFEDIGVADMINFIQVPAAYRAIVPTENGETLDAVMPFGIEEYVAKIEEYVPGSRDSVQRLFELIADAKKTSDFFGGVENFNVDTVKAILKEHMNFVRVAGYSTNEVFDALGIPSKAQDIIRAYWSYLGTPCDELGFIHYAMMFYSYISMGAVVPRLRSHEMSTAIVERFKQLGGTVWFNSQVEKILMEAGHAKGVRLTDGTECFADHIVCNASPHNAFGKLLDPADRPVEDIKRCNARVFGARGFSMFLGLDKTPQELGITDHSYFLYDTNDTRKQFDLCKKIETNNVQAVVCLNLADPDCSPEGTTVLYFTTLFTDDAWAKIGQEDYVKTKRLIAQRMIDNFEAKTRAKISDAIEEIEIAAPMTYARYTDTPQGVIYGYLATDWDGIVSRIMMTEGDEKIPGLRFAGGFGTQLLGYSSAFVDGFNKAKATLSDFAKGGAAK